MNKSFQVSWWLIVSTVAIMFLSGQIFYRIENEYTLSMIGELFIAVPVIIGTLYCKNASGGIKNVLGLHGFSPKILPYALLLTVAAQYFITYATMPIQSILIVMFGMETSTSQMAVPQSAGEFLWVFIVICIAAPVIEELLCRGVMISMCKRYGAAAALVSSSLAFALLHFEARTFIQIFFIGMLFGIFRLCTGSVYLTIIMHSANNFLSLCQLTFLSQVDALWLSIAVLILTFSFPVLVYITFTFGKKYFVPESIEFKYEKTGFSLGALICSVLFFGFNFLFMLQRLINGDCLKDLYTLIGG